LAAEEAAAKKAAEEKAARDLGLFYVTLVDALLCTSDCELMLTFLCSYIKGNIAVAEIRPTPRPVWLKT